MKFILKNLRPKTDFWLVTPELNSAISENYIKYSDLKKECNGGDKLTSNEVVSLFLLNAYFATMLNKDPRTLDLVPEDGSLFAIECAQVIKDSGNNISSYFIERLKAHNSYYYQFQNNVAVILMTEKGSDPLSYPGWSPLTGEKLSFALTDCIYKCYGYQDLHFDEAIRTNSSDFTLADAFYALERGL